MLLSKCGICGTEKAKFTKTQEAKKFLSSLCLKTPLTLICIKYFCNFSAWNGSPGVHKKKISIN